MNEKRLEAKLRERVRKLGGLALKFVSPGIAGVPDRIVLLRGRTWFVELKSPGQKPSARQLIVHRQLDSLGHPVWIVDSDEKLEEFLNQLAP